MEEKVGRIKGATAEILSIVEQYEMQAMGSLMAAWILWERALVPCLLAGAGTWLGDISGVVELTDSLQYYYWRQILAVPNSVPKIALRAEMNFTNFKWRVWQEKCLLLKRIQNNKESLAHQVYLESIKNNWPGLGA